MDKTVTHDVGRFFHHYPHQAVVVTARSKDKENAMTAVWHSPVSYSPPLYGVAVSPRRLTYRLIMESREFGINFLPVEQADVIVQVGVAKGDDVDKFTAFNISRQSPTIISAPLLSDAYACYECRVVDHRSYGDHTMFIGEVVAVHFSPKAFTSQEILDLKHVLPALYLGGDTYFSADHNSQRLLGRQTYKGPSEPRHPRRPR
ncbi:MAG: flavin reductase family protein [Dehalococcoidia bacterium]|jgi:flavin reductase (DIM6/NTAB) family NADH-FMN oxidoreductase RutF|nr:flavin reductase family protein [Dehalococcoidia bacterium]